MRASYASKCGIDAISKCAGVPRFVGIQLDFRSRRISTRALWPENSQTLTYSGIRLAGVSIRRHKRFDGVSLLAYFQSSTTSFISEPPH
eukprot:6209265-Pleurochrysis_carterae.AAC.1